MSEWWVLNSSPLITLARIARENLLTLADQVVLPRAVVTEVEAGPRGDPARQIIASAHFPVVDSPLPSEELLAWDLGAGETAVLGYVLANPGWTAILDDGAARRCARSFGLPVRGTLGIVLLAKQRGLIPSAVEILRLIVNSGFRVSDRIVEQAAALVGEKWE